ncbi:hypothetical protein Ddye_028224 [Dipteronia dyeriana]|uniref:Bulb-type lectin domain-containing protein n=1 Tax=Dipteronia dyeriana TaxID=168575 RepID=A0AAD9TRI0_9ROSI|nr:hypothetical protein Ddye_028224 [Dipteronia dyeriana]
MEQNNNSPTPNKCVTEAAGNVGPAILFPPQHSTQEEWNNILATTTSEVALTVSTAMRQAMSLNFFSPGKSSGRYLGIWYKKDGESVEAWVANRISINAQGSLVLRMNSTNDIVWSSNASTSLQNPVAVLLESGNLVVKDGNDNNPDNFLWESFDYPCDTFLVGMKLGKKLGYWYGLVFIILEEQR